MTQQFEVFLLRVSHVAQSPGSWTKAAVLGLITKHFPVPAGLLKQDSKLFLATIQWYNFKFS